MRLYRIKGIVYARVETAYALDQPSWGYDVFIVSRRDYPRLYRTAVRCKRARTGQCVAPVMPDGHRDALWQNTVGFLDPRNQERVRAYGGRPKRGLLLTGPPGNGKTSACRWVRAECERRGWVARVVGPDEYQQARKSCDAPQEVRKLFEVDGRGVVFFDDMDIALRDRDTVKETDDQSVFLAALDGIEVTQGVVYLFTTNCPLELIDPAFRRPGRIDLTLHFPKPDAASRRTLIERWHRDIKAAVSPVRIVAETDGFSFAELDELKNLLVLRYVDTNTWDWTWAVDQFHANRDALATDRRNRPFGFATPPVTNGVAH
jgi:hypothetical protein